MKLPTIPRINRATLIDTLVIIKAILIGALIFLAIAEFSRLTAISEQNHNLQEQILSLGKQVKLDTDSIHQQDTCIFLFFSQPQTARNTTSVTYPPDCVVKSSNITSSSGGATRSTKSEPINNVTVPKQQSSNASENSGQIAAQPSPPPAPTPQPQPQPNPILTLFKQLTCKLMLGLSGCG